MRNQTVAVGLGSNLKSPIDNLRRALQEIKDISELQVLGVSSIYESEAQLPPLAEGFAKDSKNDFRKESWNLNYLNAVVLCQVNSEMNSALTPLDLLHKLKKIEIKMGRTSAERWAPRLIDLDLLYWSGQSLNSDALTLPHPQILLRPFVFLPLREVWSQCPLFLEPEVQNLLQTEKWMQPWCQKKPFNTQKSLKFFWPKIMGILNITSDSFSDGGNLLSEDRLQKQALRLIESGAEILDVGAESTRPQASAVSEELEYKNLSWALQIIDDLKLDFKISLDCRHPAVVQKIIAEFDIEFLNDVMGFNHPEMLRILTQGQHKAIAMHSLTVPPRPEMVLNEVENPIDVLTTWWQKKINQLQELSLDPQRFIFDPGICFGKTAFHNLYILENLQQFNKIKNSLLIGHSRKSYQSLFSHREASERDLETALATQKINQAYVQYLRVHDVETQKMALWNH